MRAPKALYDQFKQPSGTDEKDDRKRQLLCCKPCTAIWKNNNSDSSGDLS